MRQVLKKIFARKNDIATGAMILLFCTAGVLGYFIYKEVSPSQPIKSAAFEHSTASHLPNQNLTDDEKLVLTPPAKDASPEEFKRHAELVQRLAKDAPYLNISGCAALPVVFRTQVNEKVKIKNDDSVKHAVVFDASHIYEIQPHTNGTIDIGFSRGPGIYGYGCDNVPHAVGMFLVTN